MQMNTMQLANLRLDLSEEEVEKFVNKYKIVAGLYGVYHASLANKIHHNPEVDAALGGVAMGISELVLYQRAEDRQVLSLAGGRTVFGGYA